MSEGTIPPDPGEEGPATPPAAEPEDPGGAPTAGRPAWSYFLTPLAVLLGSAAIIAAIVVTDRDGDAADPLAPALDSLSQTAISLSTTAGSLADTAETLSAAASETAAAPGAARTLRDAVLGYAALIELDVALFDQCLADAAPYEAIGARLQSGIDLGVRATPTFFVNDKLISGAQPASVFTEVIAAELTGSPDSIDDYSPAIRQLAESDPPSFAIVAERPDLTGTFIEGNPDAAVVIVEFSDFQCPFCQRSYYEALPDIRALVGNDVALAFSHFPLTQIHPNAAGAHVAAECAGAQGRFWEMHDLLFERQGEWADLPESG